MDKMKEGLQRRARRMQENLQQSVGLSEKKDELQCINHIEQRNQKLVSAVKNTKQNLQTCIRNINKEETIEKRKRRLDEFGLWQQLQVDARELENVFCRQESSLLCDILRLYADVIGSILEEKVLTDQVIEKSVIDAFGKYIEEEKSISKAKDKLARTVVDVEVSRKRKNGNHDEAKAQEIQDEYDALQLKLDNYKDNIFTDIYNLCSKETEIATIYQNLIVAQLNYHRAVVHKLESILPEVDRKIASYRRRPVFGIHLDDHLCSSNRSIAIVLEVCCSALVRHGFNEKGLFRVNGNNNRIRRMKAAFDAHEICASTNELSEYVSDPHSICSVLKCYLRELPEPLLTRELHTEWVRVARLEQESRKDSISELLTDLPESNRLNLAYLIRFLQYMLDFEEYTKMGVSNLSIVFGPNLIDSRSANSDNMLGSKIVESLILNADYFFPNDKFSFNSSLTDSFNQRLIDSTGGFEMERTPPRSTQLQIDPFITYNNSAPEVSPQPSVASSPQGQSYRSRPKLPAPPPPSCANNVANIFNDHIEEMCTSLEQLNTITRKSPSIASNDSMAEYGCINNEISEDYDCISMTRSINENNLAKPLRPPPPRNTRRTSSSPDQISQIFIRPTSYINAVCIQDFTELPKRESSVSFSNTEDNRKIIRLESEAFQRSPSLITTIANVPMPKPPLPMKPKPIIDLKPDEVTKL